MITLDIINKDIEKTKQKEFNFEHCEELAVLYIIKDHLEATNQPIAPHTPDVANKATSEFMQAIQGKNEADVWEIMDELATAAKCYLPNVYAELMRRLSDI